MRKPRAGIVSSCSGTTRSGPRKVATGFPAESRSRGTLTSRSSFCASTSPSTALATCWATSPRRFRG
jgi:hypothetical protein